MDRKIKTEEKPWQKPELIVLVRSKPEEAVLVTCKNPGNPTGPGKTNCKAATGPDDCLVQRRS